MAMEHLRTNLIYLPVISRPAVSWFPGKVRRVTSRTCGRVVPSSGHGAVIRVGRYARLHLRQSKNGRIHSCDAGTEGFKEETSKEPGHIHVEKYWQ